MDNIDNDTLLIIASKTNNTILQSQTLITRQDNKSKYLYFIKQGWVKILRSVTFVDCSEIDITVENYKILFRDPDPLQIKKK